MKYQSSRGEYSSISAAEAIKMGISPDGGLFVPDYIPVLDADLLSAMAGMDYQERASLVMGYYLEGFSQADIKRCLQGAYNNLNFDHPQIAPVVELRKSVYIQELWHGPTCAFKDMALQILPYLMKTSMQKTGETDGIVILVATSGDTGKAALEGFSDVEGTQIIVFFPEDGVSEIQKQQMITQEGANVHVAAVYGNFDDAQNGVKNIFTSREYAEILMGKGLKMSSANSINWGRLLPQIVYYISAYVDLISRGSIQNGGKINIVVPTGNFGNILAAYYAGRMGVPINKLICASNANNVLTDFIRTGIYDRNRAFEKTISPSMDILISSNLERLLYEMSGHDASRVSGWMAELKDCGKYQVEEDIQMQIQQSFWSACCSDPDTLDTIKTVWRDHNYLLDTHTAVAVQVYEQYVKETNDNRAAIIASTASPFKFGQSVAEAILPAELRAGKKEFELLSLLEEMTGITMPAGISGLNKKPVLHHTVCGVNEMKDAVSKFLGI